jgi:hypothetical protein
MNKNEACEEMRVVVNTDLGTHEGRLVPGMVGTIKLLHSVSCVVIFDEPFMRDFGGHWTQATVNYERLDPAPEGARGTVVGTIVEDT